MTDHTPAARQVENAALAALKLTPSDTYEVTVTARYCPSCHQPVGQGAAPILAALVEPVPLALPDFIEAVRAMQRRNTESRWQQPTAAIVIEAILEWIATGTTPEAICEAAAHWGECVGGGQ